MSITIATLNINKCKSDPGDIANYLYGVSADVYIITEFSLNFKCNMLMDILTLDSYHVYDALSVSKKGSVIIASKYPLEINRGMLGQNLIEVTIRNLTLGGCYMPQGKEKTEYWDRLLNRLRKVKDPYLLIGDYNNGDPILDKDDKGTPFIAHTKFRQLKDIGFIDSYRRMYGNDRTYSWYSSKGNGFRIDHAFEKFASVKRIQYDHFPRLNKLTDHSALIVEI